MNRLPVLSKNSKFTLSKFAFKSFLQQYELMPDLEIKDIEHFFSFYKKDIINLVQNILTKLNSIKLQMCLSVSFSREAKDILIYTLAYFCSENYIISNIDNFKNKFSNIIEFFETKAQDFEERGSGWKLDSVDRLDVRIGLYNAMSGGCYALLPKSLINKRAILNIKCSDNKCFLYAVIAHIFPAKFNINEIYNYKKYEKEFNCKRLSYPVNLNMIKHFEKDNEKFNIKINIYTWNSYETKKSTLKPIQISEKNAINTINLLLIKDHFYLIRNFNRLVGSYSSNYHHFCDMCFAGFHSENKLLDHKTKCIKFKPAVTILPNTNNNILKFTQIEYMYKFPFILYCDFESILEKNIQQISGKTKKINNHILSGYALIVIKNDFEIFHKKLYRGNDTINEFLKELKIVSTKIKNILSEIKELIPLTEYELENFNKANICYLCKKSFSSEPNNQGFIDYKVIDHNHLTGSYCGAAHNLCNLKYQIPDKIPVFFHNLKGYDSHFIIKYLTDEHFKQCKIIPINMEKFISFSLDKIQLLDSYQFLSESLSKLVDNLKNSKYSFPITEKIFEKQICNSDFKRELLFRKGFYPYEYVDCYEKFNETKIPSKNSFKSTLNLSELNDNDYQHIKTIWKTFDIKNLGQYHDFYMLLDTSLLADVFQAFRLTTLKIYELDPAHFFGIPGLSWAGALKYTNVELELITDIDIYMFLESGIRGGINGVTKRFCKANNSYMKNYDKNQEKIFLSYFDGM
jgi:hypothetical protein